MLTTHLYLVYKFKNPLGLTERYCKPYAYTRISLLLRVISSEISSKFGSINARVRTGGEGGFPVELLRLAPYLYYASRTTPFSQHETICHLKLVRKKNKSIGDLLGPSII